MGDNIAALKEASLLPYEASGFFPVSTRETRLQVRRHYRRGMDRSHVKSGTRTAVFDLCPYFLATELVVMIIAEFGASPADGDAPHLAMLWPPFWGIIGAFVVAFAVAARPRGLIDWVRIVSAALILPLGLAITVYPVDQTVWLLPHIYDPQVIAIEGGLGIQPSVALGHLFVQFPLLVFIGSAIYRTIIFPIALVATMEALRGRRTGVGILPTFIIVAGIGSLCYTLMPVIGPDAYWGAAFPFDMGMANAPCPRSGMPSLHNTWVMLAFLYSRGMSRPVRAITTTFMLGTALATLGLGEHYLLDIVVATPFVLLIRALCASDVPWAANERREGLLVGALLVLCWALPIRGMVNPQAVPGLVAVIMTATVVVSFWLERRLARAAGLLAPQGSVRTLLRPLANCPVPSMELTSPM